MTLIELIVAIAVLAVILVPLSMSFITMLQRSSGVEDQLSRSADAQRIGSAWTQDVQSVDRGGLNLDGSCPDPAGATSAEVQLVTFSWDTATTVGVGEKRKTASWVAVGTGTKINLYRRYCENEMPVSKVLLASRIGETNASVESVIHGPNPASPRDFCPAVAGVSKACTVVIDGVFPYRLTVARRAADGSPTALKTVPPPPVITGAAGRNTYLTTSFNQVSWSPVVDKYRAVAYQGGPEGTEVGNVVVEASSNAAQVSSLSNNTPYWVRMQSHNSVGWGELSPAFGPVSAQASTPDAPKITTVAGGDGQVAVSWDPPANNGGSPITGFKIYADGPSSTAGPAIVSDGGATGGSIPGLTNGVSYRIRVIAVNALGDGIASDQSDPVVPFGSPTAPTAVTAQARDGKAIVTWTPPTVDANGFVNGAKLWGYKVLAYKQSTPTVAETDQPEYKIGGSGLTCSSSCSANVSLANASPYRAVVQTITQKPDNSLVYGPSSVKSTVTAYTPMVADHVSPSTTPDAPAKPTLASLDATTIRITYKLPNANGGTFKEATATVDRKSTVSGASWESDVSSQTNSVSGVAGSTKLFDVTVAPGYSYRVRIKVANIGEWFVVPPDTYRYSSPSATSDLILMGGPPSKPAAPVVSRVSGNTYPFAVNVAWARPNDDGGACISKYVVDFSNNQSDIESSQTFTSTPNGSCGGEPGTSTSFTGINAGSDYRYFRVTAVNTAPAPSSPSAWTGIHLAQVCTVTATEDAWVNEDDPVFSANHRDDNYGGDSDLRVGKSGDQLFVKFNPKSSGGSSCDFGSALPSAAVVESGSVQLYNNSSTTYNRDHDMYAVSANWSEYGITYDNRPSTAGSRSDRQSSADGGYRTWNVLVADINNQRADATRFGWNVRDGGGNILSGWSTYDSRDKANKPKLNIVFY